MLTNLPTYGLSCWSSQGRIPRHQMLNDIIYCSLASANIPSGLEPSGLYRADGTCPDGVIVSPWSNGKFLVWHVIFVDTFCTSRKCVSTKEAEEAAALTEKEKVRKYVHLDRVYLFQPVAVGICGSVGLCRLIALSTRPRLQAVVSNWRAPVFHLPASVAFHGHPDGELLLCIEHSGASRTPGYCQHVVNAWATADVWDTAASEKCIDCWPSRQDPSRCTYLAAKDTNDELSSSIQADTTLEVLPTTSVTVTCLVSSPLFTAAPWLQMYADYCLTQWGLDGPSVAHAIHQAYAWDHSLAKKPFPTPFWQGL